MSPSERPASRQARPHDLTVGMASDPGLIRERNEDAALALQFMLAQQGQPPVQAGLFIVADGMGGHVHGEQASTLAMHLAARHVLNQILIPLLDDGGMTERPPINESLETSIHIAHEAIMHRLPEAGTTITLALVLGDGVYIAHAGDSRAYMGEQGKLHLLTRDHSMAARMLEMGSIPSEQVVLQRNILYKALGQGVQIEPDIVYRDFGPEQYLLLCCDGLWSMVSDEEMAAIIAAAATPGVACQNLVAKANEKGGEDNISVILATRNWHLSAGSRV